MLRDPSLELVAHAVDVAEEEDSYLGNARLKAEAAVAATGLPALADDSGLEVEALGGYPGLHSRRIAETQPERNALVLARLRDVPRPWRARFVAGLVLAFPDGSSHGFTGEVEGEVLEAPRDRGEGFGYDPLFLVPETGLTFGEMTEPEKRQISHRARAATALQGSGLLERI